MNRIMVGLCALLRTYVANSDIAAVNVADGHVYIPWSPKNALAHLFFYTGVLQCGLLSAAAGSKSRNIPWELLGKIISSSTGAQPALL